MAEGDTIARPARRLHAATAGVEVARSRFRHPRVATADLAGQRIAGWGSHGKHLLMRTDDGLTLHSHLRMSGRWSVLRPGRRPPPRLDVRALLVLADGRSLAGVALPVLQLVRTRDERLVVGHLGPDLLADGFDPATAVVRLRAGSDTLVGALLDQRRLAGLGTMWAGELCFLHHLSPWTPVAGVDPARLHALVDDARARLSTAVTDNPRQVTTGDPRVPHWVHGRAGRPCLRCGTPVAFRPAARAAHGRETWWCPGCQS
ncbi:DNA-formamidopyrimidine glycosylase family protein [Pseudonocardia xishanensis]|uniref:DNA-(apurinic or apyrimidinic site) lyase n=1 Tax=Pseudonocardia xishanensis TaxID=630995 RepID=A0ABP8RMQ3_9PSEU